MSRKLLPRSPKRPRKRSRRKANIQSGRRCCPLFSFLLSDQLRRPARSFCPRGGSDSAEKMRKSWWNYDRTLCIGAAGKGAVSACGRPRPALRHGLYGAGCCAQAPVRAARQGRGPALRPRRRRHLLHRPDARARRSSRRLLRSDDLHPHGQVHAAPAGPRPRGHHRQGRAGRGRLRRDRKKPCGVFFCRRRGRRADGQRCRLGRGDCLS